MPWIEAKIMSEDQTKLRVLRPHNQTSWETVDLARIADPSEANMPVP